MSEVNNQHEEKIAHQDTIIKYLETNAKSYKIQLNSKDTIISKKSEQLKLVTEQNQKYVADNNKLKTYLKITTTIAIIEFITILILIK